ncbi:unnamed protein product [Adineta ricciae]|uniref:Uncharacterized protein n=1 Tax=Adineta ricciae TaxID=249248 RepID=A0A813QYU7_ADIRI|nr:unnamed protein product [Adineta ricciae]
MIYNILSYISHTTSLFRLHSRITKNIQTNFIYTHHRSLICLKPLSNYQQFSSALSAKNQHSLKYRRRREHRRRRRRKKPSRVCDSVLI